MQPCGKRFDVVQGEVLLLCHFRGVNEVLGN